MARRRCCRPSRITRRDFLQGVAIGGTGLLLGGSGRRAGGAPAVSPGGAYPPALTGLRGSHPGSFEVAHALRDGVYWKSDPVGTPTGEHYDLVVVGGGISGLASAWYYRRRVPAARILIIENHDDIGGHARRNEFRYRGRTWLGFGGSYAVESPRPYGPVPRRLLEDLGVDLVRGQAMTDRHFYASRGMGRAIFFGREGFGADRLVPDPLGDPGGEANDHLPEGWDPWPRFMAEAPLPRPVLEQFRALCLDPADPMPGRDPGAKRDHLSRISYERFLSEDHRVDRRIVELLRHRTHVLFGVGIDAVAALQAWESCLPGFARMGLDGQDDGQEDRHRGQGQERGQEDRHRGPEGEGPQDRHGDDREAAPATGCDPFEGGSEYVHFPDGNATVVRLLVRDLVPGTLPAGTPEELLPVGLDYRLLDRPRQPVRIRLSSTVVRVVHDGDPAGAGGVTVSYVRDGRLETVAAGHAVLACWNGIIPHICPELPADQKEALAYGVKVPLIYASVLVAGWSSFEELGAFTIYAPGAYWSNIDVGRAVRTTSYTAARRPDEPMILHMVRVPVWPGLPSRQQHRTGRIELLSTTFEDYEDRIRDQLGRILGPAGFDPDRDIRAITVNRWSHGYAYEYSPLWDREALEAPEPPCVRGRRPLGRIVIANSDAGAYSYLDGAIEQAYRAVGEIIADRATVRADPGPTPGAHRGPRDR